MRYLLDRSWQRFDRVVVAGSPLRLFRLTGGGAAVAERLEAGADVGRSSLVERLLDAGAIHPDVSDVRDAAPVAPGVGDVTVVTPQLGGEPIGDGRLVVDDGSRPPLPGAAVRLARNAGPAAARNAARPHVSTPLVAFVDADVGLDHDRRWLERLLPHFADPRVGLVAPRVVGEAGSPLDLGPEPGRIRAGTRIAYVPAAAVVVRVEALDAVGGFDETLRVGEDVDLVWRLDEAGWWCRYEPAATVRHEPRPTVAARMRQHATYGTSAAPLALRHPRSLSPVHSNGWTAAAWTLAAAGRPVLGGGLAVGSAVALVGTLPDLPAGASLRLAMTGHLLAVRQYAAAIRRVWWPIVAVAALGSRRARLVAAAALLAGGRATPTDLAYGWGVWRGMRRHHTAIPIVPRLSSWPGRQRSSRYRRSP